MLLVYVRVLAIGMLFDGYLDWVWWYGWMFVYNCEATVCFDFMDCLG